MFRVTAKLSCSVPKEGNLFKALSGSPSMSKPNWSSKFATFTMRMLYLMHSVNRLLPLV